MRLENEVKDLKDEVQKGFSIIHNLLQTQFQLLQSSNSKAPQASPTTPSNKKTQDEKVKIPLMTELSYTSE